MSQEGYCSTAEVSILLCYVHARTLTHIKVDYMRLTREVLERGNKTLLRYFLLVNFFTYLLIVYLTMLLIALSIASHNVVFNEK